MDDDDDTVSHQCSLTAEQVDEIYLRTYKGEHEGESKAKNLETWRRENGLVPFLKAPPPEAQGNPGDGWQVLSLDTRRFYKFQWKAIECRSHCFACGLFWHSTIVAHRGRMLQSGAARRGSRGAVQTSHEAP